MSLRKNNNYVQSISKTEHSKPKESQVAGTHVEPEYIFTSPAAKAY